MIVMAVVFIIAILFILLVFVSRSISTGNWRGIFVSRGDFGEMRVSQILSRLPEAYHIFNDVYLVSNGHSSQIDHVVISRYGIFVIETKNYSGAVYGSENVEHWTQYLQGVGYEFRNPIWQNRSHELAIRNILHVPQSSIIPIVVFLGGTDLHCKTTSAVLYTDQLLNYILSHRTIAFTSDGVERLAKRLSEVIIVDPNRRRDHIVNVRQNKAERDVKIANHICPRCGGKLVERQGRYGRFLGCSNYPHCKFTVQQ